jgi:uncharacterized membrane protein YraQ (UPF0718 family)
MPVLDALRTAFDMFWEVLWPLVLGFGLSAIVQVFVSHRAVAHLLGRDSPRPLAIATALGAASSSCSYAAVALARSIFQKGASFANAIAFQLASTNLVFELGIVIIVLMGWSFAGAEFLGGIVMVVIAALILRLTLTPRLVEQAHRNASRGAVGRMEGHAAMDMSVQGGSFLSRLLSPRGFTAVSHLYVMDWASVWIDIAAGLLIAGALATWVPEAFWRDFFLAGHPTLARIEGPLVGPLVAMLSFVCSVGNVPVAAVLWRGGISFGGVVSFIFADLIILPILDIYRRYYGGRVALYLLGVLYAAMVVAGYLVELLFATLGIIPSSRHVGAVTQGPVWDYTTALNILAVVLSLVLIIRFLRTGGPEMLRMMEMTEEEMGAHEHGHDHGQAMHDHAM